MKQINTSTVTNNVALLSINVAFRRYLLSISLGTPHKILDPPPILFSLDAMHYA